MLLALNAFPDNTNKLPTWHQVNGRTQVLTLDLRHFLAMDARKL